MTTLHQNARESKLARAARIAERAAGIAGELSLGDLESLIAELDGIARVARMTDEEFEAALASALPEAPAEVVPIGPAEEDDLARADWLASDPDVEPQAEEPTPLDELDDPDAWPAWTDADIWELGPGLEDRALEAAWQDRFSGGPLTDRDILRSTGAVG